MKTSKKGLDLIKKFEGLRLKAYKCPAGVYTIGYGHIKGVKAGLTITKEQAEDFLLEDVKKAEAAVNKYDPLYHFNQNEYDALVSFAFNIGNINGITNNGKRTKYQISNKFRAYIHAGGKVLNGLIKRREAEYNLFVTPDLKSDYQVGAEYKVIVSSLNIRKEATVKSEKLKSGLKKGATVKVLAVVRDTEGNTWIKMSKGYVAGIYQGKYYVK